MKNIHNKEQKKVNIFDLSVLKKHKEKKDKKFFRNLFLSGAVIVLYLSYSTNN
jgi:hypothetical protein